LFGRTASIIVLALLIISTLALAYDIQLVQADEAITIKVGGSVDPPTPNITTLDNETYTLTSNIIGECIVVERPNILIDGKGFMIQGSGSANGFTLNGVTNVTIKNINIDGFSNGISIESCNHIFVIEDNITHCSGHGVYELSSNHCVVSGSNVTSCEYGIDVPIWYDISNYTVLSDNNVSDNHYGIQIWGSSGSTISGNTVSGNSGKSIAGIDVSYSSVGYSSSTVMEYNTVVGNYGDGISILFPSANTISGNAVSGNNGTGIEVLYSSAGSSISGNAVSGNNGTGIEVLYSSSGYSSISGNTVSGNNGKGIEVLYSSSGYSSSTVMEYNTVVGNYGDGISISNSSSVNINGSTVCDNNNGIWLDYCPNALVNGSIISGNQRKGVYLGNSNPGNVTNNQISLNSEEGVYLYSSQNGILQGNTIENNTVGIYMIWANKYLLLDNDVINQSSCGIYMTYYSKSNTAYHNNFVDNRKQVESHSHSYALWSNGYPSGGNYWSDYNGSDTKKGPSQSINGSDGIGDTAYRIDDYNYDDYPLCPSSQPSHDIGILNPEQWKTVVCQGYSLCTYGSTINYGNNDENVSIISYANGVPFDSKNSTLQARTLNTTGFTFTSSLGWNTTGLIKYVNYSLSFYASPVAGETDKSDNNVTCGWVLVTRVGDVNGDGKVDGRDLLPLSRAFGSYGPDYYYPGSPATTGWNPDADINNDDKVDGRDLLIVSRHFGEGM